MALQVVPSDVFQSYTRPRANLDTYNATNRPAYLNVLENPYFLQTLATAGAAIDPEGPAGALGAQAQRTVSSQQAARANERAISDTNARHLEMVTAIEKLGGLSPDGQAGPFKISVDKQGNYTITLNPSRPAEPTTAPPPAARDRDTTSSTPSGQSQLNTLPSETVSPSTATRSVTPVIEQPPQRGITAKDFAPFYSAPLRSQRRR